VRDAIKIFVRYVRVDTTGCFKTIPANHVSTIVRPVSMKLVAYPAIEGSSKTRICIASSVGMRAISVLHSRIVRAVQGLISWIMLHVQPAQAIVSLAPIKQAANSAFPTHTY
jgi:hypothetical protein